MHGLGLDLAAAEGDTGDADASLFRQLQLESCMELLAAAAGDSLKRMQQVSCIDLGTLCTCMAEADMHEARCVNS
jgi:hypothetical protein